MSEIKQCKRCSEIKNHSEFAKCKNCKDGLQTNCRKCNTELGREWRKANPEKTKISVKKYQKKNEERLREYRKKRYDAADPVVRSAIMKALPSRQKEEARKRTLRYKYGLSFEEYEEKLKNQDYKCEICKSDFAERYPCVDHCHMTKEIRGLICFHCNIVIGHCKDSTEVLEQAISYLKKYKQ